MRGNVPAQLAGICFAASRQVCDQPLLALLALNYHRAFANRRVPCQDRFDFIEFHSKTADLHLSVQTPQKNKIAVRQIKYLIAGPV